jgi:hypothetical protein
MIKMVPWFLLKYTIRNEAIAAKIPVDIVPGSTLAKTQSKNKRGKRRKLGVILGQIPCI